MSSTPSKQFLSMGAGIVKIPLGEHQGVLRTHGSCCNAGLRRRCTVTNGARGTKLYSPPPTIPSIIQLCHIMPPRLRLGRDINCCRQSDPRALPGRCPRLVCWQAVGLRPTCTTQSQISELYSNANVSNARLPDKLQLLANASPAHGPRTASRLPAAPYCA